MMEGPARSCSFSVCWPSLRSSGALPHRHSRLAQAALQAVQRKRFTTRFTVKSVREPHPRSADGSMRPVGS